MTHLEDISYERHTTSTSSSCLRFLLDAVDGNDTFFDTFYDASLGDVVTTANLSIVVQVGTAFVTTAACTKELRGGNFKGFL